MTFGPVGRVVATTMLFAVAAWFLFFGGLFGIAGLVVWCGTIMPRALRDLWRRAPEVATDLTRLRDESRRQAQVREAEHPLFGKDPEPPARW